MVTTWIFLLREATMPIYLQMTQGIKLHPSAQARTSEDGPTLADRSALMNIAPSLSVKAILARGASLQDDRRFHCDGVSRFVSRPRG